MGIVTKYDRWSSESMRARRRVPEKIRIDATGALGFVSVVELFTSPMLSR